MKMKTAEKNRNTAKVVQMTVMKDSDSLSNHTDCNVDGYDGDDHCEDDDFNNDEIDENNDDDDNGDVDDDVDAGDDADNDHDANGFNVSRCSLPLSNNWKPIH